MVQLFWRLRHMTFRGFTYDLVRKGRGNSFSLFSILYVQEISQNPADPPLVDIAGWQSVVAPHAPPFSTCQAGQAMHCLDLSQSLQPIVRIGKQGEVKVKRRWVEQQDVTCAWLRAPAKWRDTIFNLIPRDAINNNILLNYIGSDTDIYPSALSLVIAVFACFKIAGAPRQGSRRV